MSSSYPVGYSDVHHHIEASSRLIENGSLQAPQTLSLSFVHLYQLSNVLSETLAVSIPGIARILPPAMFMGIMFGFYAVIAPVFFSDRRKHLMATLLFGSNWGVFRFNIEFRTLNVALLFAVLGIGMLLIFADRKADKRILLLSILSLCVVGIAHFTTFFFTLILLGCLWIAYIGSRLSQLASTAILAIPCITTFLYIWHLVENLKQVVMGIIFATHLDLGISETANAGANAEGLIGLTYGFNVFVAQWFIRLAFVVAGILFFFTVALRTRTRKHYFLIMSAGTIAAFLVISAVVGTQLNPGRIMTFFAIPYSIIFVIGIFSQSGIQIPRLKTGIRVFAVVILVTAVVLSGLKFPQEIIGPTEPMRSSEPIDTHGFYVIEESDLATREFVTERGVDEVTYADHRLGRYFYQTSSGSKFAIYDQPGWHHNFKEGDQADPECEVIYRSANSYISQCG